jgi:aspartyl protease family protein
MEKIVTSNVIAAWHRSSDLLHPALAWLASLPPLMLAAIAAFALASFGGFLRRYLPFVGGFMRACGNVALFVVLGVGVLQLSRLNPSFGTSLDAPLASLGMPRQQVAGAETRVPMAQDGHFWITAKVNGSTQRFMVDTGAPVSAIASDAAVEARLEPDMMRLPVTVRTANGATQAQVASVKELRFGSVVARDLQVVITENSGGLNLLGMNFLNRLKGWRVEDGTLILTPRHPQAAAASS